MDDNRRMTPVSPKSSIEITDQSGLNLTALKTEFGHDTPANRPAASRPPPNIANVNSASSLHGMSLTPPPDSFSVKNVKIQNLPLGVVVKRLAKQCAQSSNLKPNKFLGYDSNNLTEIDLKDIKTAAYHHCRREGTEDDSKHYNTVLRSLQQRLSNKRERSIKNLTSISDALNAIADGKTDVKIEKDGQNYVVPVPQIDYSLIILPDRDKVFLRPNARSEQSDEHLTPSQTIKKFPGLEMPLTKSLSAQRSWWDVFMNR